MIEDNKKTSKHKIWVRGFFMLLMVLAFQVSGTVLFIVTLFQFVLAALSDSPNDRLVAFGRTLGQYLQQLARFLTFATEDMPFPFSNWPPGD